MKTLKQIYDIEKTNNKIEASFYAEYNVKQGLRNKNGTGVKVGLTKICDVIGYDIVDGQKHNVEGQLIFRGYPVSALIEQGLHYEDVAFLLLIGRLPNVNERKLFLQELMQSSRLNCLDVSYHSSNLLNALQVEVLKLYSLDACPESDCLVDRFEKGFQIFSSIPLFIFSHFYHRPIVSYPFLQDCFAKNILSLARDCSECTVQEVRVMDTLLMLHADHGGGNNSTFANVVVSSTGTDVYSCMSAAIGSLKGPRHGGAAGKVSRQFHYIQQDIGACCDRILLQNIIDRMLNKDYFDCSGLIYGIGHAIYTKSDPRAVLIKRECELLAKEKNMEEEFKMLSLFEKLATETMFKKKNIVCCANVDYYSGFAYWMLGIDPELFTPLFAISRMSGWLAHHLENCQSNKKLIRPANVYIGGLKNDN